MPAIAPQRANLLDLVLMAAQLVTGMTMNGRIMSKVASWSSIMVSHPQ